MIRELSLRAFKRFQDERLPLAPLTLLTGFNSGGKSSCMQALLLLSHAVSLLNNSRDAERAVPLNGPGFSLGDLRTTVNEIVSGRIFSIATATDDARVEWTFGESDCARDSLAVPCKMRSLSDPPGDVERLSRALRRMRFVPADRLGPAELFPLDDPVRHEKPEARAEMAFGNLWHLEGQGLRIPSLRHPNPSYAATFTRQVQAWLGDLFPGVVLDPRPVLHANALTLGIRTNDAYEFHRPHNVGFGITYVLPAIIALLMATPGDIVMLENPEAHLHPRAQARMARFCAKAAAAGVQVIVESHSDHVLNGIRVAVHEGVMAPEDVSILFFAAPSAVPRASVQSIRIDRAGRLGEWPSGFFDEGDQLLDRLLELPGAKPS